MRTALTLDPDVAARTQERSARLRKPFNEIVNAALRLGLDRLERPAVDKPYKTKPAPLGWRTGYSYDHVADLLDPERSS